MASDLDRDGFSESIFISPGRSSSCIAIDLEREPTTQLMDDILGLFDRMKYDPDVQVPSLHVRIKGNEPPNNPTERQSQFTADPTTNTTPQPNSSMNQFSLFTQLPPELRSLIWEMTLPRRILRPLQLPASPYSKGSFVMLPAPIIAHVCRESRQVAVRHGRMECIDTWCEHRFSWFDTNRDILDLSSTSLKVPSPDWHLRKLAEEARAVILHSDNLNKPFVKTLIATPEFRQTKRAIYLQQQKTIHIGNRDFVQPDKSDVFFGDDALAMLDMRDVEWLKWFHLNVKNSHEYIPRSPNNHDKSSSGQDSPQGPKQKQPSQEDKAATTKIKAFVDLWTSHDQLNYPTADTVEGVSIVRAGDNALQRPAKLPQVRLVQCFELSNNTAHSQRRDIYPIPFWHHILSATGMGDEDIRG